MIIHTGDFKIDHTPIDSQPMDFIALSRLAGDGALLLLSDSTYAEVKGYTESEQVVARALDRLIGEAPGRVMVATFASLISRVKQVIDSAVKYDRKVAVVGRSMANNVKMARKMGLPGRARRCARVDAGRGPAAARARGDRGHGQPGRADLGARPNRQRRAPRRGSRSRATP